MRFKNVSEADIEGLFKVVDQCHGRVDIVTNDMILDLKSELVNYFLFTKAFSDGAITDMELVAFEKEDRERLIEYMTKWRK